MFKNQKIIAIIPARSGSKGLKDKNIKILNGKPLIAYTIDAAKDSEVFDKIIVSTDSENYAKIGKEYGAEVPFLRSGGNSGDMASSWDVVREVLAKLDEKFDIVILLQPTSPLRTAKNIREAIDLFFIKNASSVISVCETSHPTFWCGTLDASLSLENFIKEEYLVPRQQLPKTYTYNGAIYIMKAKDVENSNITQKNSFAYIMDRKNSIDIDSELDFKFAELIMQI